ncbi:MAG: T9SS type A sorting domain-containing protein [Flavisolibacter sp.]
MNKLIALFGVILFISNAEGQSVTPQIIISAGFYASGGGISLSQSIGETFTSAYSAASTKVSQGEQQFLSGVFILPLTWINTTGYLGVNDHAELYWKVEESNVSDYSIQKLTDNSFQNIGNVKSIGNGLHEYHFTEPTALSGTAIYRIMQRDIDGRFTYSHEILLRATLTGNVTIYPNPSEGISLVYVTDNSLLNTQAALVNMNGIVLKMISLNAITELDMNSYPNGMYLLKLQNGKSLSIIKKN